MGNDRFYLPKEYPNVPNRSPVLEDMGSVMTIAGMVMTGMGATLMYMLPDQSITSDANFITLTVDEWGSLIKRLDDPEIFIGDVGGIRKTIHRKLRWNISGEVQQRVWARDGFKCIYCRKPMGQILMTIDHFVPLELGGINDESNYLTACKRCNKDKGMEDPREFCHRRGLDYNKIKQYLENGGSK